MEGPEHESRLDSIHIKMSVLPAFTPTRVLPSRYTRTDKPRIIATLVSVGVQSRPGFCFLNDFSSTSLGEWRR